MRDLRPDGLSEDGRSLLLSDAAASERAAAEGSAERYRVPVDERLRSVLRGRPATNDTRVESALPPREIQARLRAGATVEEVARAAGIPVARVQRYEVPIAAERARVVSQAREATVPPTDRTHPGQPLGQLVDAGLTRAGIDPAGVAWEARRQPDSSWIVRLPVGERGCADFSWDAAARRVRPIDPLAHDLLAPAPPPPDEAIEAVAQATGVTARELDEVPLAVGAEGGRRLPGRAAGRPATGLVVLAGSRETDPPGPYDDAVASVAEQPRPGAPTGDFASAGESRSALPGSLLAGSLLAGSLLPGSLLSEPAPGTSVPGAVWPPSAPVPVTADASTRGAADHARTVPGGGRGQQDQAPVQDLGTEALHVASDEARSDAAPAASAASSAATVSTVPSERDDALFRAASLAAQSGAEAGEPASGHAARRRSPGRRGEVPAWDDIVFGAKRS